MSKRGVTGIGRTQRLLLHLLAVGERPKSARDLAYDWPSLSESAARSALDRLGARGLVDVAGWDSNDGRTYSLTVKGAEAELALADGEPS